MVEAVRPNTRTSPVTPQVASWRGQLTGFRVVIATQTRAEVLCGVEKAGWGVKRRSRVEAQLAATTMIPVNETVISAYVKFRAECGRRGHHFQDSAHTADTWICGDGDCDWCCFVD